MEIWEIICCFHGTISFVTLVQRRWAWNLQKDTRVEVRENRRGVESANWNRKFKEETHDISRFDIIGGELAEKKDPLHTVNGNNWSTGFSTSISISISIAIGAFTFTNSQIFCCAQSQTIVRCRYWKQDLYDLEHNLHDNLQFYWKCFRLCL